MELLTGFFEQVVQRWDTILELTMQHLYLSLVSLTIGILIAVPLGVLLTRYRKWAEPIIGVAAIFQTIPSLALLGFMLPLLGIGALPSIVALTIYALLPILRNTFTGIIGVDQAAVDAGRGMGMTTSQRLIQIELPLALPFIMAGVRTATVLTIGVATLAAFIGAGGLGKLILRGIQMNNNEIVLTGAIPAALLAIILDFILKRMEIAATPRGLRK
jgi:osmoprotectant transport system permease protein